METDGTEIPRPPLNPEVFSILLNPERCSGCGRCVAACRKGLFTLNQQGTRKKACLLESESCDLCRRCIGECLFEALSEAPAA